MRDHTAWRRSLAKQLGLAWPGDLTSFAPSDLLDVELGLYLLEDVMGSASAADAWTLFGGYPYAEAFGHIAAEEQRLRIRRARHHLWPMRRRRTWRQAVAQYLAVPQQLRGYDLSTIDDTPRRRVPSHASQRFELFERVIADPPAFATLNLPIAPAGDYWFPVKDQRMTVNIPDSVASGAPAHGHDLGASLTGAGAALDVTWKELQDAAADMDAIEAADPDGGRPGCWVERLARVELLVRDESAQEFLPSEHLQIGRLLHMVGMVGAGKSTVRDILAYWTAIHRGLRTTILVGDVAESLTVVQRMKRLGVSAAPILGHSTRRRHIQRLHRRVGAGRGENMLAHDDQAFTYLSSACPLDALRGLEASRPLNIAEAPCTSLYSEDGNTRHGCPLWTRCPRHNASRDLVDAKIWVANPAALVHTAASQHLQSEQMRYLELACRMSDLIIVDEADRVQMQLDTAFAPATTLAGTSPDSWLDEVASHKIAELARLGRLQLSAHRVADWAAAVDTVTAATNRIYTMLIQDKALRDWISEDYFSALTLHQWLTNAWFPELKDDAARDPLPIGLTLAGQTISRDRVDAILDRFRDDPLHQVDPLPGDEVAVTVNALVHLTLEILHAAQDAIPTARLRAVLTRLVDQDPRVLAELDAHVVRLQFTLLLAALHHQLNVMTGLWPQVEAALRLENTSNVLSRRPPRDYEPILPESPMGNVLGFQFKPTQRSSEGVQSGELRFFRCSGVGRELLRLLGEFASVDGRPGPNVILMSATSWAGTSSRFHIEAPVGAVLRPQADEVDAIKRSVFRKEFLRWPDTRLAIKLSGTDSRTRPAALNAMLNQLAVPDRTLPGATSMLEDELADIDDPDRRRILLLVGSYAEARAAGEYLNAIPEWHGRVVQLVSDDTDLDHTWIRPAGSAPTLRRGDVAGFARTGGEILVAPLLAVERGHNIVLGDGRAAIGTVYFLARPHPRPDDIALAVQAINDWAVRLVHGPDGQFADDVRASASPDEAALAFRRRARQRWNRYLTRQLSWSALPPDEKVSFTWDQMVVIWQVIGRLVRGGVPARVVFVDAAFSPREAGLIATDGNAADTPATSLLAAMRGVLAPYFTPGSSATAIDRSLVHSLYEPLFQALTEMA